MNLRPDLSVIIPTYNRPDRLEKCLLSIAHLDYPRDCFQVIVVDDGSRISLKHITDKFSNQFSLSLIRQDNAGPASARNTGAAAASGEYLVFTDDDCQPESDWLSALATIIKQFPNALIGGYTINALPENAFSTASQLLIDYLYSYYNGLQDKDAFFASNNLAVPRELFEKLGGFDTSFPLAAGEDREFCDRWQYHGYPTHFAPEVKVRHAHKLRLDSFWRQHSNYGRGAYYFHLVKAHRQSERVKVEPLFFYWELLIYPFSKQTQHSSLFLLSLLLISQIANIFGFLREKYFNFTKA